MVDLLKSIKTISLSLSCISSEIFPFNKKSYKSIFICNLLFLLIFYFSKTACSINAYELIQLLHLKMGELHKPLDS